MLLFDDDVLTMQAARVLPPITARTDGIYALQLREYDPAAYSETTAVTDTPPSLGTSYASDAPPVINDIEWDYSGTLYSLVGSVSGRATVGDSGRDTTLSSATVRLPNNIPFYGLNTSGGTVEMLKVDNSGSGRLVVGDGAEHIYCNGLSLTMNDDTYLTYDWSTRSILIGHGSGSDVVIVGNAADSIRLWTKDKFHLSSNVSGATTQFYGWLSGTGTAATTTELPSDHDWCIWEETDTNTVSICVNDGGTIRQIT